MCKEGSRADFRNFVPFLKKLDDEQSPKKENYVSTSSLLVFYYYFLKAPDVLWVCKGVQLYQVYCNCCLCLFDMQRSCLIADGFVIMECEEPITGRPTGQILLDYLTDTVLTHKTGLFGHPHVSPNSRCVVTLDRGRDGVTLVVQEVVGELHVCLFF